MKYLQHGIFLGCVLSSLVIIGYGYFQYVDKRIIMPYIFLALLLYFYLLGFFIASKSSSTREGIKAGFIAGAASMLIVAVTFFFVHNVFFYNETISEPGTLAGFKSSGLLSIQRYLVYNNIRFGVLGLLLGSVFAAFCAYGGSFTATHFHKH
jgi:hypothetical protein